ncbi:Rrf2 family transcriptional regulator [Pilimelia columellifera]
MRLNRSTDIGLRVVMFAASHDGGQHTIDELAEALAVPRHHLAKVVQRLQRLGAVGTVRGRAGGVRITTAGLATTVGTLVRAFEGEAEVVECDEPVCPLRHGCRLRGALRAAQEAFYRSLDPVTIAELIRSPTREVLLTLHPPTAQAPPAPRQTEESPC